MLAVTYLINTETKQNNLKALFLALGHSNDKGDALLLLSFDG
jgi:hypothetical protein